MKNVVLLRPEDKERERSRERKRTELFNEFSRWGYDERGWSARTRKKYYDIARSADQWLVDNRDAGLLYASTQDLKAYLFSTVPNPRNRNNIRQALIAFGHFMVGMGWRPDNGALLLPRLPEPDCLPRPLSDEEAARTKIAADILGGMHQVIFYLLGFQGLRKSETRLLEWPRIEAGHVRILGKGRGGSSKQRDLPLHPEVKPVLNGWRSRCQDARWVFPSPQSIKMGKPISERGFDYLVDAIEEESSIHFTPHQLRHTFATKMLEGGANLREV